MPQIRCERSVCTDTSVNGAGEQGVGFSSPPPKCAAASGGNRDFALPPTRMQHGDGHLWQEMCPGLRAQGAVSMCPCRTEVSPEPGHCGALATGDV